MKTKEQILAEITQMHEIIQNASDRIEKQQYSHGGELESIEKEIEDCLSSISTLEWVLT